MAFGSRSVVVKLVCPLESPKELLNPLVPKWHGSQGGLSSRTVSKSPRGDSNVNRWSGTPSRRGSASPPVPSAPTPNTQGVSGGSPRLSGGGPSSANHSDTKSSEQRDARARRVPSGFQNTSAAPLSRHLWLLSLGQSSVFHSEREGLKHHHHPLREKKVTHIRAKPIQA